MDNKISLINVDGKDYRLEDINTALKSYSVNLKGAEWIKILKVDDPNILASGNIAVNCYGLRSDTGAKQPLTASLFSLSYGKTKDDELVSNIVPISQSVDEAMSASSGSGSGGGEGGSSGEVGSGGGDDGSQTVTYVPVPNEGYVEKIYFNTSLSIEEVDNIINNANLEWMPMNDEGDEMGYAVLTDTVVTVFIKYDAMYNIYSIITFDASKESDEYGSEFVIYTSNEGWRIGLDDTSSLATNVYEVNVNTMSDMQGIPIGTQNEALSQLIYIEQVAEGISLLNEGIEVSSDSGEAGSGGESSSEGGSSGSAGSGGIFYGLSSVRFSIEEDGTYLEGLFSYPTLTNIYDNLIIDVKIDNNINLSYLDELRVSYDNGNENLLLEGSKLNIKSEYTLKVSAKWKDLRKLTTEDDGKTVLSFDSILENGMSGNTELLKVSGVNNEDEFVNFQYGYDENLVEFYFENYSSYIRNELNTKKIEYLIQNVNGFKTKVDIFKFLDNLIGPYTSSIIEEISIHNFENQVVTVQDKENLDIIQSMAYYLNGELVEYPFKIRRGDTLEIEVFLSQKHEESLLFCVKPVINSNENIVSVSRKITLPDPFFENVDELTIVNLNYWDLDVPLTVQVFNTNHKTESVNLAIETIDYHIEWINRKFDKLGVEISSLNNSNIKIFSSGTGDFADELPVSLLESESLFVGMSRSPSFIPNRFSNLYSIEMTSGTTFYSFDSTNWFLMPPAFSKQIEAYYFTPKTGIIKCKLSSYADNNSFFHYDNSYYTFEKKYNTFKKVKNVEFGYIGNTFKLVTIEYLDGTFNEESLVCRIEEANHSSVVVYFGDNNAENGYTNFEVWGEIFAPDEQEHKTIPLVELEDKKGNIFVYDFNRIRYKRDKVFKFEEFWKSYIESPDVKGDDIPTHVRYSAFGKSYENFKGNIVKSTMSIGNQTQLPPFIVFIGNCENNYIEEECSYITLRNISDLRVKKGCYEFYLTDYDLPTLHTNAIVERYYSSNKLSYTDEKGKFWIKIYNKDTNEWEVNQEGIVAEYRAKYFVPNMAENNANAALVCANQINELDGATKTFYGGAVESNKHWNAYAVSLKPNGTVTPGMIVYMFDLNGSYKKYVCSKSSGSEVFDTVVEVDNYEALQESITNLEAKLNNLDYIEDEIESTSNIISVPENAQPIGMIDYIGGNTYTSENLLVFDDVEETTVNGVTYSIKDGIINIKKVTERNQIFIELKNPIEMGTYALETFNSNFGYALHDLNKEASYGFRLNGNSTTTSFKAYYFSFTPTTAISLDTNLGISIKPILIKGSTMPAKFSVGYSGFKHSACSSVLSQSLNILDLANIENAVSEGVTYSIRDGVIIVTRVTSSRNFSIKLNTQIKPGSYQGKIFSNNISTFGFEDSYKDTGWGVGNGSMNNTINMAYLRISLKDDIKFNTTLNEEIKVFLMEKNNQYEMPNVFTPFFTSNKYIPQSIQNLNGYGWGLPETIFNNYLDLERKVYVERVQKTVLNGTEFWTLDAPTNKFYHDVFEEISGSVATPLGYCNNPNFTYALVGKFGTFYLQGQNIYFPNTLEDGSSIFANVDEWKAYLQQNPLEIIHARITIKETPVEEIDEFIEIKKGGRVVFNNDYNLETKNKITVIKKVV